MAASRERREDSTFLRGRAASKTAPLDSPGEIAPAKASDSKRSDTLAQSRFA
jgi:hypothetical protein